MRLHTFPGGLKLDPQKAAATAQPIQIAALPKQVVIPLQQHMGAAANPCVEIGQQVKTGECIATPVLQRSAAVHASICGTVVAIENRPVPHPSGESAPCIVIEGNGQDDRARLPAIEQWQTASRDKLLQRLREAGIVGLGGAAFPSDEKLSVPRQILIINGAECEPYIACDEMLMRERAESVIEGSRLLAYLAGAEQTIIAVEDSMPQALASLKTALCDQSDLQLISVPTIYPEGGERQLIKVLTNLEVPSGGLPRDIGVLCHNVGTAAAAWRAVVFGEALVSRLVSVNGSGVAQPNTFEVRIGTAIGDVIAQCGGYNNQASRLIMGGPMMGLALPNDALPIVKATNCVLVLSDSEVKAPAPEVPCIRCGECVRVCPASLLPQQLHWFIRAKDWQEVANHSLFDCIECGCCALVCPSQIPLVDYYRFAKSELATRNYDQVLASKARERFDARQLRLQRDDAERAARLAAKRAPLTAANQDPIQAAIERSAERKALLSNADSKPSEDKSAE